MTRWIQYKQLWQLISAHFKEIIREPGVLFWGIIFPILMSVGLGIAFTQKADMVRNVAVISENNGQFASSDTTRALDYFLKHQATMTDEKRPVFSIEMPDEKLGNTIFHFRKMEWKEAINLLKRGNLNLILLEKNNQVEYHFDPLNPDAQLVYLKLSSLINSRGADTAHQVIKVHHDTSGVKPLTLSGTRYIDFLIPGLISMGVMMSCMWGLSYGIIEKRSKKLLRRMIATPMKKSHFLVSFITVRMGMNLIEALLLFVFAYFAFGITISGSLPAIFLLFIAGNISFAGIAIFLSSHTSRTEIGNGLINSVVMPMMVLSGIFFSYHNFPDWSIPYIRMLPLTLLADGTRSIFIEGARLAGVAMPVGILLATGLFFFILGLKIFKWH